MKTWILRCEEPVTRVFHAMELSNFPVKLITTAEDRLNVSFSQILFYYMFLY